MAITVTLRYDEDNDCLVAEEANRPGMIPVGRSKRNIYKALGRWFHNNQDRLAELGVTIELDDSAFSFEMARREKELAQR